jgi:hypothetical protein
MRSDIGWTVDPFAEGADDGSFTEDRETFLAAQQEWMEAHLPPNGESLEIGEHGRPKVPATTERIYNRPGKEDRIGYYIKRNAFTIQTVPFRQ